MFPGEKGLILKLLITGGAGFIGSAVIRHVILSTQDHVVNVDKLTYASNLESLASVSENHRYAFEQVDICDRAGLSSVFARHQPDAVMHLAAETHVDRSINGPAAFIASNIVGTYTVLEAARHYWQGLDPVRKAAFRLHHISTDEVYGDLGDSPGLFSETSRYAPSSPYSASKAGSDHLVWAWHRTYGFPVLMTTCSNNYGPYQYPEKLIPLVIQHALQEKPLPLYGSGEQVRDWLYVEDHARALYTAITQGKTGETYTIGAHNQQKNIDVVRQVCALLDTLKPRPHGRYQDLITHVADRPGHDQRYAIDASKIQRELGWMPVESFASGLRKTVEWYVDNHLSRFPK